MTIKEEDVPTRPIPNLSPLLGLKILAAKPSLAQKQRPTDKTRGLPRHTAQPSQSTMKFKVDKPHLCAQSL